MAETVLVVPARQNWGQQPVERATEILTRQTSQFYPRSTAAFGPGAKALQTNSYFVAAAGGSTSEASNLVSRTDPTSKPHHHHPMAETRAFAGNS